MRSRRRRVRIVRSGSRASAPGIGKAAKGVRTAVSLALRGERIRIIGAGYWRRGKVFYDQANRLPR